MTVSIDTIVIIGHQ